MKYLEWLIEAKKKYEFLPIKDFDLNKQAIYLVHFGCPINSIEVELEAEVPATCFVNLDSHTNDVGLCDRLVKTGWEIGYRARMDSTSTLFNGELAYFSQFFDIQRYWSEQTFPFHLPNSYFDMKDYIRDISETNNHKSQVLIKGNI